jgi:hypothetical protein
MLCSTKTNTFCTKISCCFCIFCGVSELVLTFNFLKLSAQLINFEKSPEISGLTVGTSPKIILPVEPSIVIISPSLTSLKMF